MSLVLICASWMCDSCFKWAKWSTMVHHFQSVLLPTFHFANQAPFGPLSPLCTIMCHNALLCHIFYPWCIMAHLGFSWWLPPYFLTTNRQSLSLKTINITREQNISTLDFILFDGSSKTDPSDLSTALLTTWLLIRLRKPFHLPKSSTLRQSLGSCRFEGSVGISKRDHEMLDDGCRFLKPACWHARLGYVSRRPHWASYCIICMYCQCAPRIDFFLFVLCLPFHIASCSYMRYS